MVSEITRGSEPVRSDLSLQAEVPRRDLHVRAVVIHCCLECIQRPGHISADAASVSPGQWERISSGLIGPWIFEAHVVADVTEIPRWQIRESCHVARGGEVVECAHG